MPRRLETINVPELLEKIGFLEPMVSLLLLGACFARHSTLGASRVPMAAGNGRCNWERACDLAEQLEEKDCKGNRWVLAIPRLLLLELLVEVLLTTDPGLAVTTVVALPDDADLLFGVALVPARGEVGRSRVGRVDTTFPPRPVVRKLDLDLLVGGLDRLLLLDVTVRRREDAEGDGDSCFKIQLDCPVRTELSSPLALFSDDDSGCQGLRKGKEEKIPLASSWGKEVEREERKEKDPTN